MRSQEIWSNPCSNALFPFVLRGEIGFSVAELVIQFLTACGGRKPCAADGISPREGGMLPPTCAAVGVKGAQIRLEFRLQEVLLSPWLMEIPSYSKTEIS